MRFRIPAHPAAPAGSVPAFPAPPAGPHSGGGPRLPPPGPRHGPCPLSAARPGGLAEGRGAPRGCYCSSGRAGPGFGAVAASEGPQYPSSAFSGWGGVPCGLLPWQRLLNVCKVPRRCNAGVNGILAERGVRRVSGHLDITFNSQQCEIQHLRVSELHQSVLSSTPNLLVIVMLKHKYSSYSTLYSIYIKDIKDAVRCCSEDRSCPSDLWLAKGWFQHLDLRLVTGSRVYSLGTT